MLSPYSTCLTETYSKRKQSKQNIVSLNGDRNMRGQHNELTLTSVFGTGTPVEPGFIQSGG